MLSVENDVSAVRRSPQYVGDLCVARHVVSCQTHRPCAKILEFRASPHHWKVLQVGILADVAESPSTRSGIPFASLLTVQGDQDACRHLCCPLYTPSYLKIMTV